MAKAQGGKKAKAAKAAAPAGREILVVGTKVKEVVRNEGCMSSSELMEALSDRVHELLLAAITRAKENDRATVRPYDL